MRLVLFASALLLCDPLFGATVSSDTFGMLSDGRAAKLYTLRNAHGLVAKITDYGATITELAVPDRAGELTSIVLGSDDFEAYQQGQPAASTIGRYANRIRAGRCTIDGREIQLTTNLGKNHIHGGTKGFAHQLWESRALPSNEAAAVEMTYRSADAEEGYPGNCTVTVVFTLRDNDELVLDYTATTDQPTILNLTNHAYFNLAGAGDVLDHELQIFASNYTPTDADLIPTGEVALVRGTALDFTQAHRIGERIAEFRNAPGGYDHNYVLDGTAGELRLAARVTEPKSGRVMECWTTEPALQLYTANHFNGKPTAGRRAYSRHAALCLETQHYPDSPNHPEFPSTVLRPDKPFHSTTKFRFRLVR